MRLKIDEIKAMADVLGAVNFLKVSEKDRDLARRLVLDQVELRRALTEFNDKVSGIRTVVLRPYMDGVRKLEELARKGAAPGPELDETRRALAEFNRQAGEAQEEPVEVRLEKVAMDTLLACMDKNSIGEVATLAPLFENNE